MKFKDWFDNKMKELEAEKQEQEKGIRYKGVTIKRVPDAKKFPIDTIKEVLDKVPFGKLKLILVENTPAIYSKNKIRAWAFYRNSEQTIFVSQKAASSLNKLRFVLAHEFGHSTGLKKEGEAERYALKYYNKPKGLN